MQMLKAKLYRIEEEKRLAEVSKKYDAKGEVSFGSQDRDYVMQPYTMVRDQNTEVKTSQVTAVMDGEIDEFIDAYLRLKAAKLHKKGKKS
jgi:peptide chain release factor 2